MCYGFSCSKLLISFGGYSMTAFRSHLLRRWIVALALMAFTTVAQAGLVSTSDALAAERGTAYSQIEQYLLQDAVRAELQALGVAPELALSRVQALSTAELQSLAGRISEQPAGAGVGLFEVLGITFLVLIILEFVGVTNIFNR